MKPRSAKQMLVDWLNTHEGWHNKAKLTTMRWAYDDDASRAFAPDTIAPKLREAEREERIKKMEKDGQTYYAGLGTPAPKRIVGWETVLKDGERLARPIFA